MGGSKLWPCVWPAKTWSRAIVGACGSADADLLLGRWTGRIGRPLWPGLARVNASELGDWFESGLKRNFRGREPKPPAGHIGLTDRLDAFFGVPVFASVFTSVNLDVSFIVRGVL
jgi:CDP-diglyceride synthetase